MKTQIYTSPFSWKRVYCLFINDLKLVFRDKILFVLFFLPLVLIPFVRWVTPWLSEIFPLLNDYYSAILAFFCLLMGFFPAAILSFVMLDEKDQDLFKVMRVMPLPTWFFVSYRVGLITLLAFVNAVATMQLTGLLEVAWERILGMAFLVSLLSPLTTLTIVAFAHNKIEGMTLTKGLNFLMILVLAGCMMNEYWEPILGVIPIYWTYQAFFELTSTYWIEYWSIGVFMHLGLLRYVFLRFQRRIC